LGNTTRGLIAIKAAQIEKAVLGAGDEWVQLASLVGYARKLISEEHKKSLNLSPMNHLHLDMAYFSSNENYK
jgi:hypothetical protein